MKNLANCKPSEFLKQTNRIRKSVENWLKVTDIMGIRNQQPIITEEMTDDEKKKAYAEQARKNITQMLDSCLDEHPDETLEVLALMCFVEPKDVDKHPMSDYLQSFTDLINDKAVISFLSSLIELGQTNGSDAPKQ